MTRFSRTAIRIRAADSIPDCRSQYDELVKYWQGLNRFTGSISFNHQPTSWLRHRLNAGTDRIERERQLASRLEPKIR